MNWEAVAALSTAFTGLVIAVTAIAALREVRVASEHAAATRDQLEHLRKSTQFEGSLAVFSELDTPRQIEARRFVQFELAERLKDERFRYEVGLIAGADESEHKELTVLRCFERMGLYVQKGFVDPDVMYMIAAGRVITTWHALEETVAIHRAVAGPFWWNFERLYESSKQWMRNHGVHIDDLERAQLRQLDRSNERAQS